MAGVLEAMGFPRDLCERAVSSVGGIEPALELLLQWQADGGAPPAAEDRGASPSLSSPPRPSVSAAAVSSVTDAVGSPAGLDAVVPDAGIVEQNCRPNATERLEKVQEEEWEVKNARWRSPLAATPGAASGSNCRDNMSATPVELQIRCSGYPTLKGTFVAGSTLKEVRDFVQQELRTRQPQQPVGRASSGGSNRQSRRTSRSNGISALLPTNRVTQRTREMSRYVDPSSSANAPRNVAIGNMYFLIPFPRSVFDTEESMETTLFDAGLYPRGILTVQFQTKEDPSISNHISIPHEFNSPLREDVHSRDLHTSSAQLRGGHPVSRHAEDIARREQRLKATLDRYSSEQNFRNATNEILEKRVTAAPMLAPRATPSAVASSVSVPRGREERALEVDGERVRYRELALQAAAKRMTEAAQMFREGFMSEAGEPEGEFHTSSEVQPVAATISDDGLTRFVSEDRDSKGKQVADCGPSSPANQPAEVRMHDVGSNFAGFRGRPSRARLPLPCPSPARPEKMQRTDEASSTSFAGANHVPPLFASGHAIDRTRRRGEEASPSERWIRGSPGSGSSPVSELRIRLEDGSVLRHTFPAYTTLQSVCEFAIPGRSSTAEYGLILPMPGSHFFEGEALSSTLEEVGLVPSGVVHLQKVASRGLVTQGRRRARRMIRYLQAQNEPEPELEQLWQDFSRHMNTSLTYEELVELEDSIGRVNVGVPEATIANLPTHTVSRSAGDICIVCLSEMVDGEEVMLLPCLHTFHPACIRQWLVQSTCCPTCKHYIT